MYQQELGRFMSRDPLSEDGVEILYPVPDMRGYQPQDNREHPYAYVRNNPTNAVDPSGLVDWNSAEITSQQGVTRPGCGDLLFDIYEIEDYWNTWDLRVYKAQDGKSGWCHGFTFGGLDAGGYSIAGGTDVEVVLEKEWKPVLCCMIRANDIVVFYRFQMTHSAIVKQGSGGAVIDENTTLTKSKWGCLADPSQNTLAEEAQKYGKYECYSKTPRHGCCARPGGNERQEKKGNDR